MHAISRAALCRQSGLPTWVEVRGREVLLTQQWLLGVRLAPVGPSFLRELQGRKAFRKAFYVL